MQKTSNRAESLLSNIFGKCCLVIAIRTRAIQASTTYKVRLESKIYSDQVHAYFSTFLLIWKMRSTTGIQMKYTQNFWFKKKNFFSIFNNSNLGLVVPKPLYHGLQFNKCTIFFIRRIPLGAGLSLCCQLRFQECLQSMYLDTKNIQWEMELAIPWLNSSKVIAVSSPIIVALDLQEEQPA